MLIWVQADTHLLTLKHQDMKWWMSELGESPSCWPEALSLPVTLPIFVGVFPSQFDNETSLCE